MTREIFFNELRGKLKGLPKDDIETRIAFYDEMINDLMDEGLSENDAINKIGPVDKIVDEIASDTSLTKLVKERIRPKRKMSAMEIVLLIVGFPLWFPLLLTAFILTLVGYLLIWVLVLVMYVIEISLGAVVLSGIVVFAMTLFEEALNYVAIGSAIFACGAILLTFPLAKLVTKLTIKLSRNIVLGIKRKFVRRGEK